jgi:hypothetical protein
MDLSPEVHASIIKIAGDWALAYSIREKRRGVDKKFAELLRESFEGAYHDLLKIVRSTK